jgi:hypothetical protein
MVMLKAFSLTTLNTIRLQLYHSYHTQPALWCLLGLKILLSLDLLLLVLLVLSSLLYFVVW